MVCRYFELLIEQYCTHCTNTSFRIRQRWIGNPLGNSSSVCPGKSCVLATSCHGLDESWSGLFCFWAWLTGKRAFHNIFRHLTFDWAHYTRFKWEDSGWEWGPGLHFNWGNLFGPHFLSFSLLLLLILLRLPPSLAIKLDCPGLCKGFGWLLLSQAFGCVDWHSILLKI